MLPRDAVTSSPETLNARIAAKLGGVKARSDLELVGLVEKRLPVKSIKSLVHAGLSDGEVYDLILPRRTLAHRMANRQPLSVEESERAMRIARVTSLAEQVFR